MKLYETKTSPYGSTTITGQGVAVAALTAVVVPLALASIFGSFAIVKSGYIGVVTTAGKVTGEMQPGIHTKWPFIQHVTKMNVQVQKDQTAATAATNDLQDVTSTVALNYHLDHDQVDNVFVNLSDQYADRIIAPTIQEAVKSVSAKYSASELLTKRASVADDITHILITRLQPRGIVVDQLSIVDFRFSREFTASIESKQVAQQNAERAEFTLQQAQKDAQAQEVVKASLTPEILQQQAIAKWNGVLPLYVGQGSILNIPLSK
jgi:regulator of protease activity HflC (stomatin/prohibitin superfamily)